MTTTNQRKSHKTAWQEPLNGYKEITQQELRALRKRTPEESIKIWEEMMRHPLKWKKL